MSLSVVAVSAPNTLIGVPGEAALKSSDPASLFNACRLAAAAAETKDSTWSNISWQNSNWGGSRKDRRSKLLLMNSWLEDRRAFRAMLIREKPNLLLIGAMTLCMPGAVACAEEARDVLGDKVYIVLGGRHINETFYTSGRTITHHVASPLLLMAQRKLKNVFDLVIAGQAEALISNIGTMIDDCLINQQSFHTIADQILNNTSMPGQWLAGWMKDGKIQAIESTGFPIVYEGIPSISHLFGVSAQFDCFDGRKTAHAFSDSGNGCAYDCLFCSERNSVTKETFNLRGGADRLYQQFKEITKTIREDSPKSGASAFVEDSMLLGANPREMARLAELLEQNPLDIRFGAQLTIDMIIKNQELLSRLKKVGLDYLFIGLETEEPTHIGGMSKDTKRLGETWTSRAESTMKCLNELGIKCGAALLFGMNESLESRVRIFTNLKRWRTLYNNPILVSMNWAVQHPLRGFDGGHSFDYLEWGTPEAELNALFSRYFGEASSNYPLNGCSPPTLEEVQEVCRLYELVFNEQEEIVIYGRACGAE